MADTGIAIALSGVGKSYTLEQRPWHRLWQQLLGRPIHGLQHHALQGVNLELRRGESLGIIGRNGAGKSTLLQLVCGVLDPSTGTRKVEGRIAALLELGAGFNPELSGRENVRLNGPLLGLSSTEMERRLPEIIEFAGIGEFVDQPVRSYSSGMFVRLAFAMATSVEPDILVIDEALSVGDGVFARRSFDRIMALKERGATVLFCSHSTYHIEALCNRVLWLEQGRVRMLGAAAEVVAAYNDYIGGETHGGEGNPLRTGGVTPMQGADEVVGASAGVHPPPFRPGEGRILSLQARAGQQVGRHLKLHSGREDLVLDVAFQVDPALPAPSVLMALATRAGTLVASAGTHNDGLVLERDARGNGRVSLTLPKLPLLKGEYVIDIYLACERGLHYYATAPSAFELQMTQDGLEQGVVNLGHRWAT
ncbi:ABC transporter ATP-binding protein [Inhella proteolytica]|uniref:ATP-binding cassette domain-containing protein n=1 Tax=Inhella proteolytica TaxID=2795029 RepID=A0A931J1X8_9BURK|nr:polysaccharide ABC transporter ATP-binding protein [Inhella proteolytica]MBH9578016.1 ATP-binding cassette domain-containing protein [Inhella proteolytica]